MHINCFIYNLWYLCHIVITSNVLLLSTISWLHGTKGEEMSRRRTSNVCQANSDCPSNAYCEKYEGASSPTTGQCICHRGFIIIAENRRRECYKAASTIDDSCTHNEQCMITLSTESECISGRCKCQNGAHFVQRKNTCYKSVRVGDFCTLTNNCIGDGTICRSGVCHCPYGKHPRYDFMDCVTDVKLGEKCKTDDECVAQDAYCDQICRCKPNFVMSKNGNRCLKVAKRLHDDCEEDQQCSAQLEFSKCDSNKNNTCVCKEGHHEMNYVSILSFGDYPEKTNFSTQVGVSVKFQKCWVSVPLGGICEADENCAAVDFTVCKDGKCVCHDDFTDVGGQCSSAIKIFINQRILILTFLIINYLFIV